MIKIKSKCSKVQYRSKESAEYYIEEAKNRKGNRKHGRISKSKNYGKFDAFYTYKCPHCEYWHLTRKKN